VQWVQERPTPWIGLILAAQVFVAVLFGWLALALQDWSAGFVAVLALIGAAWHGSVLLRVRAAQAEGAVPLTPQGTTAARTFACKATHSQGARSREGVMVVISDLAAFVPIAPWRGVAGQLLRALFSVRIPTTRVVLARLPASRDELVALVHANQGMFVDASWAWHPSGGMLVRAGEVLITRLPQAHAPLWPRIADDPQARRAAMFKATIAMSVVAVALAGLGALARLITGDPDYLVAGLAYAGLVLVALAIALFAVSRTTDGAGRGG
jgi:hypothetical protein